MNITYHYFPTVSLLASGYLHLCNFFIFFMHLLILSHFSLFLLANTRVIKYEKNPMLNNSSRYKDKAPKKLVISKPLDSSSNKNGDINSPEIIIDSVLRSVWSGDGDDKHHNGNNEKEFLLHTRKELGHKCKERESFGTIIESLSFKLALQIEALQESIVKKDQRIEALERANLEQMTGTDFDFICIEIYSYQY